MWVFHEIFSEFLQPFRYAGTQRVAPFCLVVFVFYLVLDFLIGLVNGSPRSFRSTCELDTDAGSESVPHMFAFAPLSLSLDTVIVGEVDELQEDVG